MTACVRIYTSMGKENCCTVDTFSITTEHYSGSPTYSIRFIDGIESRVTEIERIVEAGQPCNMHIRYKDSDVESVCTLNGCKLDNAKIVCDEPDLKIIGYSGDRLQ